LTVNASIRVLLAFGCASLAASAAYSQALPNGDTAPPAADQRQAGATPAGDEGTPLPAADDEAAAANTVPANAFETRIVMEQLLEAGDFDGALALSTRLLNLATQEFGAESAQVADAHLLIGRIQRASGNYTAAETSILSAIDVYEKVNGPLSAPLIDPFLDLGDNYVEAGDDQGAVAAYGEARTITRRTYGLLSERQLDIIDEMSDAALRLGQIEDAKNLQLEALTLVERNSSETSLESIDARFKYAAWLRRIRQFDEERRLYFEIQRLVSRDYNDDPVLTARTLRARAASFRAEGNGDSLGYSGLQDALEILQAMPEPPLLLVAQVYLDIGDWNVEFSRTTALPSEYIDAWQLLGQVENGDTLRHEWFDSLTVVQMNPVSPRGLSTDPNAPMGYVEIYFTVDPSGRSTDLEITDSYPPGFKDAAFLRQYRDARFRPRVENGELVPARRARRNEFRYDPDIAAKTDD
jgi:tetratricopeptide (TPR) repeat protein